jgi:hypothetical protein
MTNVRIETVNLLPPVRGRLFAAAPYQTGAFPHGVAD